MSKYIIIRDFIQLNLHLFKPTNKFSANLITDPFNIPAPDTTGHPAEIILSVQRFTRRKANLQNQFNRVLAQRGLYMSSKGSNFYIKSFEETKAKVASFYSDAERKRFRGSELATGLVKHKCKYTHVTNSELAKIN